MKIRLRRTLTTSAAILTLTAASLALPQISEDAPVDTGQVRCYSDTTEITFPAAGQAFRGQDALNVGVLPCYRDNGDGTVTDLNTGLMWQQDPGPTKLTKDQAAAGAAPFSLAGYSDWRLPTIKELYSLILFSGNTGLSEALSTPYLDTDYFVFRYGDTSAGERFIDAQYVSATDYIGTTMGGDPTTFGVNFADGRIKGYGTSGPMGSKTFYVQYVRGNSDYGVNDFVDHGDGTITDRATDLMWMEVDSGTLGAGPRFDGTLTWEEALDWADGLVYGGHDDWRLPDAKELQMIVDYTRAPLVTGTSAIDVDYFAVSDHDAFYWTSTTHCDGPSSTYGAWAAYIAFGTAYGYMEQPPGSGNYVLLDVHGAGAQRSDPKAGDPADPMWTYGHGPQGDIVRIHNHARLVRGGIDQTLGADDYTLSAGSGGAIDFALDAGVAHAGRLYLLVGSMSGTVPGTPLSTGLTVPLNFDWFTLWTLNAANSPALSGSFGTLDGVGEASAFLDTDPLPLSMVGLTADFAYLLLAYPDFVSNAVAVEIES